MSISQPTPSIYEKSDHLRLGDRLSAAVMGTSGPQRSELLDGLEQEKN